jgi:hypothetical protein
MIEEVAKKQAEKIFDIIDKVGEVDAISMLEKVFCVDIRSVDFSDIEILETFEKWIIYYECLKSEIDTYLHFDYFFLSGMEHKEEMDCIVEFIDNRICDFIRQKKEDLIMIGILKKDYVIGDNTIKMRNLIDPTFFELCYFEFKGEKFYNFLEKFNETIRSRVIEAYSYFEKWGDYRPKETTASNLKEYYEVLPRFELSAIYAEAERAEKEKVDNAEVEMVGISKAEERRFCFGYNYSREQIDGIFNVLVNRGMVEKTEKDNFYKVFTSINFDEIKDIKIKWLNYYTYFPILIRELADKANAERNLKIWALAKMYFVKANGDGFDDNNMKSEASKVKQENGSKEQDIFRDEILEIIKTRCK